MFNKALATDIGCQLTELILIYLKAVM